MNSPETIVRMVYYTGAGLVLIGSGVRYLFHIFRDRDRKDKFVSEMELRHLPNIYAALDQIASVLGVSVTYPNPRL